jgi:hypothetical protein
MRQKSKIRYRELDRETLRWPFELCHTAVAEYIRSLINSTTAHTASDTYLLYNPARIYQSD